MTTFDENKLEPAQYSGRSSGQLLAYRDTVMEFMGIVRDDAGYFLIDNNARLLSKFCALVNRDTWFHLASNVIPEFRNPFKAVVGGMTPLDHILLDMKLRLPPSPLHHPGDQQERALLRNRGRQLIEYMLYEEGQEVTEDERQRTDDLIEGFNRVLIPDTREHVVPDSEDGMEEV